MIKRYFSAILLPFIISGCGSSDSKTTHIGKGTYIDSAVQGVSYECGSEKGITNEKGEFYYEVGKDCQFFLGNYIFKKVKGDKLQNAKTKVYEKDVRVARFLQILDSDGDASNGITIIEDVIDNIPEVAFDFNDEGMRELYTSLKNSVPKYNGKFITEEEARIHINSQYGEEDKDKESLNFTISPLSPKKDDLITFDASEIQGDIESYSWRVGDKSGDEKIFRVSNLNEGDYSVKLTIKYKNGRTKTVTKGLHIAPLPTKWDEIDPILEDNYSKLYIRTDKDYTYIKLQSDRNLLNAQFFIDSDDDKRSGMKSNTYGDSGFDYVLKDDGLYKLIHRNDFSTKLVQSMNYDIHGDVLEVAIDKTKFDYLSKEFAVMVYFLGDSSFNLPKSGTIKNYTDMNFNSNQQDKVPPIITVIKPFIIATDLNYTKPTSVTAYDVFDKKDVTVSIDDSQVDKSKNGYYSIIYTAKDSSNNISKKSTIVQIIGNTNSTKLELKKLGEASDDVVIDYQSGLVWANDNSLIKENEVSSRGCYFMGGGIKDSDAKLALKEFCKESDYAGFHDWRVPTPLELSKFTFRMQQEKQEPGMGKHGCVQLIAIDENNNTKAVWTRKHKVKDRDKIFAGFIDDGFNFPAGGRCVRGKSIDSGDLKVDYNTTFESAKVIKDSKAKLMWVDEFNPENEACLAIHVGKAEELLKSKDFCENLDYAGYKDWKMPTSSQLSNFIKKSNKEHMFTGYEAPCSRLLAKDGNVSKVVYTRFDTNSSHTLGGIDNLEANLTSNVGLRCVRDN
jgi:hypothetical protein